MTGVAIVVMSCADSPRDGGAGGQAAGVFTGRGVGVDADALVTSPACAEHRLDFAARRDFFAGAQPRGVAVGDFDGDGRLDIVVRNEIVGPNPSGDVNVLLGNGDGTFQPPRQFPTDRGGPGIAVGDFNGDHELDVVVINFFNGTVLLGNVGVLLGNGDGTLQPQTIFPVGAIPRAVAVGHFNRDHALDIVTANGDGTVSVLLGNGDGTFQPATRFPAGALPGGALTAVAVGDFNGDKKLDLAVTDQANNVVDVLLGNGDGTFKPAGSLPCGSAPSSVAVGDFNDDRRLDLAVTDLDGGTVSVLFGNGNGTFQPATTVATGLDFPGVLVAADFNGDHRSDLAIGGNDVVLVLLGNRDGTFKAAPKVPPFGGIGFAVGDFNGDRPVDLAVVTASVTVDVLLGKGNGTFRTAPTFPTGASPQSVTVGDLDGDHRLDLVTANIGDDTVSVLLGKGNGAFRPPLSFPVGAAPVYAAVGDFNCDHRLDVAVANLGDNTVSVLLGERHGVLGPAMSLPVGERPVFIAVDDFNGDHLLDLAVVNRDDNTVGVLLGKGDGMFGPQTAFPTGAILPVSVTAADFNGDGALDLVTANFGSDNLSVLFGKGDGTFQGPQILRLPTNAGPVSVAVADLNGDGKLDLAVADGFIGEVSLLLGNGDGTFQPAQTVGIFGKLSFATGTITAGDFNGDGKLDLAVLSGGDDVAVLLGNGDGTFLPSQFFGAGGVSIFLAAGDFNADHQLDLAVANAFSNDVSVLLNTTR